MKKALFFPTHFQLSPVILMIFDSDILNL